ncbi:hypothetical protein AAMO2058_000498900 [Amorphochlora amoebiformis]
MSSDFRARFENRMRVVSKTGATARVQDGGGDRGSAKFGRRAMGSFKGRGSRRSRPSSGPVESKLSSSHNSEKLHSDPYGYIQQIESSQPPPPQPQPKPTREFTSASHEEATAEESGKSYTGGEEGVDIGDPYGYIKAESQRARKPPENNESNGNGRISSSGNCRYINGKGNGYGYNNGLSTGSDNGQPESKKPSADMFDAIFQDSEINFRQYVASDGMECSNREASAKSNVNNQSNAPHQEAVTEANDYDEDDILPSDGGMDEFLATHYQNYRNQPSSQPYPSSYIPPPKTPPASSSPPQTQPYPPASLQPYLQDDYPYTLSKFVGNSPNFHGESLENSPNFEKSSENSKHFTPASSHPVGALSRRESNSALRTGFESGKRSDKSGAGRRDRKKGGGKERREGGGGYAVMHGGSQGAADKQSRERKQSYKPYTLEDYRAHQSNVRNMKLGGLGANVGSAEWQRKREKRRRMLEAAALAKNHISTSKPRGASGTNNTASAAPRKLSARERARIYATKIKKPRSKSFVAGYQSNLKSTSAPSGHRIGSGSRARPMGSRDKGRGSDIPREKTLRRNSVDRQQAIATNMQQRSAVDAIRDQLMNM